METQDNKFSETKADNVKQMMDDGFNEWHRQHRTGRFLGGLIIVAVGVIFLLRQMNAVIFPDWLFTWPVLVMVIGFYIGARHNFMRGGWLIVMLVGAAFLAQEFLPNLNIEDYIWPAIIIIVGLFMILPRKRNYWHWGNKEYWKNYKWEMKAKYGNEWRQHWREHWHEHRHGGGWQSTTNSEDYIDSVSVFGGTHKVITSKDFKGGDIVNMFGGGEVNLMGADIKGRVVLDVVQIFGGTKIIIPSDWEVQSKAVSIFGSVEDKRNPGLPKNPDKVLVIDGTSIFAGVDILSY